jgi:hypothetical protein
LILREIRHAGQDQRGDADVSRAAVATGPIADHEGLGGATTERLERDLE